MTSIGHQESKTKNDLKAYQFQMETLGLMAEGLAHKLNNLMTTVISNTNFLLEELDKDNPACKDLETIKQAGIRSSNLIRHMTILAQQKPPETEPTDLNHLIKDMDQTLQQIMGDSVIIKTKLDPRLEKALTDPSLIEEIIMNIALNAKEAMPNGGDLNMETTNVILDEVYTRQWPECGPGPHVMLAITDTGIGMDSQIMSRVFEPFFTTKDNKKYIGLGLFAARHMLKQMNSRIEVQSEPNKGASIKIYLPTADMSLI